LFKASSVHSIVPERGPAAAGANSIPAAQEAPASKVEGAEQVVALPLVMKFALGVEKALRFSV
jgi:hypothetical protein